MRWKRKLEIIEAKPQSPHSKPSPTSTRSAANSRSVRVRSHSQPVVKFQISARSNLSGIEGFERINSPKNFNQSIGLGFKHVNHEEDSSRMLSGATKLNKKLKSPQTRKHSKSEYSLGIFTFPASIQGALKMQKRTENSQGPPKIIKMPLNYTSKQSLPELLNNGCDIFSPSSSKVVSPKRTTTQFHLKTPSVQLHGNSPYTKSPHIKKEPIKKAKEFNFSNAVANPETVFEPKEKELNRPQTCGEAYFERKPYSPARFIKIKNLTTHEFAAENYNMLEKVREEYGMNENQAFKDNNELTIVENYRRKLNQNFIERFGHYQPGQSELLTTLNEEGASEYKQDIIPTLEKLESLKLPVSSQKSLSKNHLIVSNVLHTRKTIKSITSLTKLDARKAMITLLDANKRPGVIGLPDNVIRIKPIFLDFKGEMQRKILKPRSVKIITEEADNYLSNKEPVEDQEIKGILEQEIDIVAPPSKLSALQQFSEARFQGVIKKNAMFFKDAQPVFKRVRRKLLEMLTEMKRLKLAPKDRSWLIKIFLRKFMENWVFSSYPYQKPKSKVLILACKKGDFDFVRDLLFENRFLVYDFDQFHLTALHWSIRRGFFAVSKLLIDKGADVNAKDLIGRTPLYFAIMENRVDLVKLLLHAQSDPWSTEDINYMEISEKKTSIKYFLSRSRQMHIVMKMTPPSLRNFVWEKQTLDWIMNPNRSDDQHLEEFDEYGVMDMTDRA